MRQRRSSRARAAMLALGVALFAAAAGGCSGGDAGGGPGGRKDAAPPGNPAALVTFVELGSDKCVPCIQMRSVMQEIEALYGQQVRIVFHDVWTDEGAPYARQYRIRGIPTQVFLDADGREFHRHEGYFPTIEGAEILAQKGVKKR